MMLSVWAELLIFAKHNDHNFSLHLEQVDAVHSALSGMGFQDIEIVVAETGWPSHGDANEVGPSLDNAKAYNGNLITHLRSLVGTPLMPGKSVDTYIFALYDEDLKPGPASERSFGLFKTDLTVTYDVGLAKTSQQVTPLLLMFSVCMAELLISKSLLMSHKYTYFRSILFLK